MLTKVTSFLWVASAYDNPGVPAFQVDVTDTAETMEEAADMGNQMVRSRTLNVAQAEAEKLGLADLIPQFNAANAGKLEALAAQVAGLTAELEEAQAAGAEAASLRAQAVELKSQVRLLQMDADATALPA